MLLASLRCYTSIFDGFIGIISWLDWTLNKWMMQYIIVIELVRYLTRVTILKGCKVVSLVKLLIQYLTEKLSVSKLPSWRIQEMLAYLKNIGIHLDGQIKSCWHSVGGIVVSHKLEEYLLRIEEQPLEMRQRLEKDCDGWILGEGKDRLELLANLRRWLTYYGFTRMLSHSFHN